MLSKAIPNAPRPSSPKRAGGSATIATPLSPACGRSNTRGVPKIRALAEATYFAGLRKAGMPETLSRARYQRCPEEGRRRYSRSRSLVLPLGRPSDLAQGFCPWSYQLCAKPTAPRFGTSERVALTAPRARDRLLDNQRWNDWNGAGDVVKIGRCRQHQLVDLSQLVFRAVARPARDRRRLVPQARELPLGVCRRRPRCGERRADRRSIGCGGAVRQRLPRPGITGTGTADTAPAELAKTGTAPTEPATTDLAITGTAPTDPNTTDPTTTDLATMELGTTDTVGR